LEDVVAGLHGAIASRVAGMVRRLKIEPDVVLTGGVAKNIGVVSAMRETLGCEVLVPEDPLLSGALGAALLGRELMLRAMAGGELIQRRERHLEGVTFFK
jgi:activator of 2-hydroxyglutaryl-CoA dehydratase